MNRWRGIQIGLIVFTVVLFGGYAVIGFGLTAEQLALILGLGGLLLAASIQGMAWVLNTWGLKKE